MKILVDPKVKALIFDLDGTLADTMPTHMTAWVKAANHFHAPLTEQMVQEWAGMPSFKIVARLNELFKLTLDPMEVSKKKAEFFFEIQGEGVNPIKPIYEIAEKYKDTLPMGIGTGSRKENAEKILGGMGIRDWFKSVVTADDVENHKPEPETYLKCAAELGVAPKDCVVFEDADFGILAAKAAGMAVVDVRDYLGK